MRRGLASLGALALGATLLGTAPLVRVAAAPAPEPPPRAQTGEDVVLIHGLGRSDRAMRPLERALGAAGYRVHNLGYESREGTPEQLVATIDAEIDACCAQAKRLHFVTHSLGGLLLRAALAQHPRANLGRVVMLAPPNHGSAYADVAHDSKLAATALGPAVAALGTDAAGLASKLPPPDYEVGVIAGTKSRNPLDRVVDPEEGDGAVSVESARLPGMRDFLTVEATHASIRRLPAVHAQVLTFLATGHFDHAAAGAAALPSEAAE